MPNIKVWKWVQVDHRWSYYKSLGPPRDVGSARRWMQQALDSSQITVPGRYLLVYQDVAAEFTVEESQPRLQIVET